MKEKKFKVKNLFKSRIFFFVLGIFLTSVVGVSASTLLSSSDVTYDNSGSGMSATTVQDALDELNEKAKNAPECGSEGNCTVICPTGATFKSTSTGYWCVPASTSIGGKSVSVVTSGSGLYADSTESGRYIYRGSSPNNYITFNGSTWRILAVESDRTLKIMKQNSIGVKGYSDTTYWPNAYLKTYLNGDYYKTLDSTYIQSHVFNVGTVSKSSSLTTTINEEKRTTWTGNIAIANVSDYIKSNTNTSSCGSVKSYNDNYSTCKTSSFMGTIMAIENYSWLLSLYADYTDDAWVVYNYGILSNHRTYMSANVFPVLHLASNITLSGSGTSSVPYVISG